MRRLILIAAAIAVAGPAYAECQTLGFSVNDYGKDGPTRDAKSLLDNYIKDWADKNGVRKYRTSKKDVSCELFLDFIVFDEHTCKATATVCWNKADKSNGPVTTTGSTSVNSKSTKRKSASPKATPAKKEEPKV